MPLRRDRRLRTGDRAQGVPDGVMRKASCCCRDCTITVEGEPALNAICNCTSCKRRTGSAFGWSAYFPDDAVVATTGKMCVYAKDGDAGYNRSFCARCGTTLYWKSFGFLPDHTGIAAGCSLSPVFPRKTGTAARGSNCRKAGCVRRARLLRLKRLRSSFEARFARASG
jgi:hypothetical protein